MAVEISSPAMTSRELCKDATFVYSYSLFDKQFSAEKGTDDRINRENNAIVTLI